jgi:hypothetical protein
VKRDLIFLVGFPRSGHSLLGSILQQNKEITATSQLFTSTMFDNLVNFKLSEIFVSYPDHDSANNLIENCFDLYFKNWKQKHILQRTTLTPDIITRILEYYPNTKIKFVILERDVLEVLASIIKWSKKEPTAYINSYRELENDYLKCKFLMDPRSFIRAEEATMKYLKEKQSKNSLFIDFYKLTKNPKKEIDRLYKFLNIKNFKHDFNNLKQFKPNNISYNDLMLGKNLYKIYPKIKPAKKYAAKVLDKSILQAYKKGAL